MWRAARTEDKRVPVFKLMYEKYARERKAPAEYVLHGSLSVDANVDNCGNCLLMSHQVRHYNTRHTALKLKIAGITCHEDDSDLGRWQTCTS